MTRRGVRRGKQQVCPLAEAVDAVLQALARWRRDAYAEYQRAEQAGKLMQMCELNAFVQMCDACRQLIMSMLEEARDCLVEPGVLKSTTEQRRRRNLSSEKQTFA